MVINYLVGSEAEMVREKFAGVLTRVCLYGNAVIVYSCVSLVFRLWGWSGY